MKKSGKTYIWPDKQDISWETDDKLVATVAEPTMNKPISILTNM
jgi:beta-glucanase (GH16 family)